MKATVRVLISVLALVVAGAVTAPAASGVSPAPQNAIAAVMAAPAAAGAVVSVTPTRIADSRTGLQIPGPVAAVGTAVVQLIGRGGIPGIGVAAVLATVTVVAAQQAGYLTVWPSETIRPGTSNVNFEAGQSIANTALLRVGTQGGVEVFNGSYGTVQVIVDVTGYTLSGTPTAAGAVVPVVHARVADSRVGAQISGAVSAVGTASVQVTGRGGIPGNGVAEVVATVTAVGPRQPGYVTVWPSLTVRPGTSNQNFQAGQNIATTVVVPLGVDGKIQLFNGSDGSVDLLMDVTGYTLAGIATDAGTVGPVTARLADTRTGPQVWGAVPALGAIEV